jgi:hypothetical protein
MNIHPGGVSGHGESGKQWRFLKMPDKDVTTIKDLIYYQYAKIIARRASASEDGMEAKKLHYGFIKKTFKELKKGDDLISPLLEKKYLKTIYYCHECAQTLMKGDIDGDQEISVLDIDYILH